MDSEQPKVPSDDRARRKPPTSNQLSATRRSSKPWRSRAARSGPAAKVPGQQEGLLTARVSMMEGGSRLHRRDEGRVGRGRGSLVRRIASPRGPVPVCFLRFVPATSCRLAGARIDEAGRGDIVLFTRHRRLFAHRVVMHLRCRSRDTGRCARNAGSFGERIRTARKGHACGRDAGSPSGIDPG